PLVAVHVNLDAKRKPRLHLDVNEAHVAVEKIVVQVQALAVGRLDVRGPSVPRERKRAARFEDRHHADESLGYSVSLGDLERHLVLPRGLARVLVGAASLNAHRLCVSLEPLRLLEQEWLETLPP